MKKYAVGLLGLFALASVAQAQSVSITIDAGLLENSGGTAALPTGSLLQLIALPNGTTGTPTSGTGGSYLGTGDVLVASFAMNYNSGATGETINDLSSLPLTNLTYTTFGTGATMYSAGVYALTTGEKLELRFYSGITYTSTTNYDTSSPTAGTKYNQVRSDTLEGGDPLETTWVVPASGSVDLDYNTVSDSGPYANTTGYASLNVAVAGVPEPSTYGTIGGALMSLMCVRAWKRRSAGQTA